jgi:pimeloyl-ACP methyl ester carboxylesterase
MNKILSVTASCLALTGLAQFAQAEGGILGVTCESPPPVHCAMGDCGAKTAVRGNAKDPVTGREYFLDYPCDLKPDEKVVFILNIHGAGSIANWQRHYFPAMDYKEKYRLVVATSTAEGSGAMGSGPGIRMWMSDKDDAHLQNITSQIIEAFGKDRIKSFWLAGHSQGGMTSQRLVCTDFFADKVDGVLSLSGGRVGGVQMVAAFGPPLPDGSPPPARERPAPSGNLPSCDFSHIYTTGEHEIVELPDTSSLAAKFSCDTRVKSEVVDTQAGWVEDSGRKGYPVWGMDRRPGTAVEYLYPNCDDNRLVADVVRIDKGHTEGLEPLVTERIVELMVAAKGGKISGK